MLRLSILDIARDFCSLIYLEDIIFTLLMVKALTDVLRLPGVPVCAYVCGYGSALSG